ncbi:MAG TPA: VCBS repeat-containing protein [Edaphobacter sp.]|nr:VCBS repeat-containing protein [Edaphobacter sp.]
MIRTAIMPNPATCVLAALLAVAAISPISVWAAGAGTLPAAAPVVAAAAGATSEANSDSDEAADTVSHLMVMADFNRDGIADIAQAVLPVGAHSGPAVLTVSLGQANGGYKQVVSRIALGHAPRDIVTGDFNQDGFPDLIVGDEDGSLMLFAGDGTGNLSAAGDIAHLSSVVSIAVADFNHDGILDVAVTDWRASSVTVLLGVGKGLFRNEWSALLRMPGTSPHLAAADFNGDGIPDLAVVYDDDEGSTFDVMLGNGKGAFTLSPRLSLARDPNSHCVT